MIWLLNYFLLFAHEDFMINQRNLKLNFQPNAQSVILSNSSSIILTLCVHITRKYKNTLPQTWPLVHCLLRCLAGKEAINEKINNLNQYWREANFVKLFHVLVSTMWPTGTRGSCLPAFIFVACCISRLAVVKASFIDGARTKPGLKLWQLYIVIF